MKKRTVSLTMKLYIFVFKEQVYEIKKSVCLLSGTHSRLKKQKRIRFSKELKSQKKKRKTNENLNLS